MKLLVQEISVKIKNQGARLREFETRHLGHQETLERVEGASL